MGEELYFFKLDKKKAKVKLTQIISEDNEYSFRKFLTNDSSNYEVILAKIKNDITLLSEDDLWDVFNWFFETYERLYGELDYEEFENLLYENLRNCGMDKFYEIPSKSPVRAFHNIMINYPGEIGEDLFLSYNCSVEEFNQFLDYLICYTGELSVFLYNTYHNDSDCSTEIKEINSLIKEINFRTDSYFYNLALAELKIENEYNLETVKLSEKLSLFRYENMNKSSYSLPQELREVSERESYLMTKAGILYYGIELKEKLNNYKGAIVRLHSI